MSSDDRISLWFSKNADPKQTKNGAIWAYSEDKLFKLKTKGFPERIAFHPHGI
jgi:hypothetical protein